jgi:hypothetical protein
MKKLFAGLLLLVTTVCFGQTFPVQNLNVLGQLQFNGSAGTAGFIPQSNGSAGPTWVSPTTLFPTLPLSIVSGGTGAITAPGASNNLQYLQGGTGSAARSLTNKFQDSVSILDFAGVDSTGATDSTAGIQASITAICAKSTGGIDIFPPGSYAVSSQITIPCANVYLQGAGTAATQINSSATSSSIFVFSGFNDEISGMQIAYTSAATAGAAVNLSTANAFVADRVTINNAFRGILVTNSVADYFSNLFFNNMTPGTGVGIYINGGNDQFFNTVTMGNPSGSQPRAGYEIVSSGGVWMNGVDAIHSGTGLLIDPPNGSSVTYLFIENSAFDTNAADGIALLPFAGGTVYGSTFSGSWTASSGSYGVHIGGTGLTDGVRFIGHRSFDNGMDGYFVQASGSSANISFNNCDASGNSLSSSGTFAGFEFGPGVSGFSVTNSRAGQEAGLPGTQGRGILIDTGASTSYLLTGNDLRGNAVGSLSDGGTGSGKIVKGNLGYNPIANTIISVGGSPFTFTNNTGDTVSVFISGGTVSLVQLAGATIGTGTNVAVPVPQGVALTVTYSGAPGMSYLGY